MPIGKKKGINESGTSDSDKHLTLILYLNTIRSYQNGPFIKDLTKEGSICWKTSAML